jgi:hypothetical protein
MRSLLVRTSLLVAIAVLALQSYTFYNSTKFALKDSVQYWAAARLLITSGNPYSPGEMLELQQTVGWSDPTPLMMWNPPWALSIVLPLGFMSYPLAKILWSFVLFAVIFLSSDLAWQIYNGPPKYRWLSWLLGITFVPTLVTLKLLQIGPIMLLGVVGFLYFQKNNRPFMAGMACILMTIKPHFLYLFWVCLVFWIIRERQWRVLMGMIVSMSILITIPHLFNLKVLSQYVTTVVATGGPSNWATPTLGGYLRLLVGVDQYWLQFISLGVGLPWCLWYWLRRKDDWSWEWDLPNVLMASIVTASYGWTYDQVVLIPLLMSAVIWCLNLRVPKQRNLLLIGYAGVNLCIFILRTEAFGMSNEIWFGWVAPLAMFIYLMLRQNLVDAQI